MEKRGLVLSVVLILAVAMFAGNLNSNNGVTGKPVLLQGTGKPVLLQKPAPAGEYDKDCVCSQKIEERCVTSCLNVPFDCKRGYTIVTSCSGKNECNILYDDDDDRRLLTHLGDQVEDKWLFVTDCMTGYRNYYEVKDL